MRGSIRRRLLALAVGIGGGLAALSPLGFFLEDVQGLDLLFAARGPLPAPAGVAVVGLHADAANGFARLGAAPAAWPEPARSCALRYPGLAQLSNDAGVSALPREAHACLIDVLTAAGAAAVAFDIVFVRGGPGGGAQAIAEAAARSGRVVLVRKVDDLTSSYMIRPLDGPLEDAGLPTASFVLDHETARATRFWTRHPALPPPHDVQLALRTLEMVAGRHGDDGRPPDAAEPAPVAHELVTAALVGDDDPARQEARAAIAAAEGPPDERLFNLYGPPGTITSHSVADVLLGRLDPDGLRAAFAGRAVFVGLQELRQTSRWDTFDTAFSRDGIKLSGVELGATAYANLLDGSSLRRPPPLVDGLMVAGLGTALTASAAWAVPVAGIALSAAIALGWAMLCAFAFTHQQLVLPVAVPLLIVLPLALGGGLAVRYLRASDGVRAAVPRPAAERLLRRGLDGLEERPFQATVMMTDVAGWSSIADRHGHDHAHRLLNELFGLLTPIVGAERGLVLNFVADAMTAYWPAHGDPSTAAERACRAALAIERALALANERFTLGGEPPLRMRIGINAGIVSAGATGALDRTSYALVGETMNTTQRIERLGKLVADDGSDTVILIADGVRRRLGPGFVTRDLGPHRVPGRDQPVHVHRLLAPAAWPVRRVLLPATVLAAVFAAGAARAQDACPDGATPAAMLRSAVAGVTVAGNPLDLSLLPEAPVCAGEAVAVPAAGRAELQLVAARTELRLDGGTELLPVATGGVTAAGTATAPDGFAVRLLRGAIYLLSRTPRRLTVETAFVTAGIDGTEVLLRVDPARRGTDLLVLEGAVAVTPDLVGRRLTTGQRLTLTGTTGTVTDVAAPGAPPGSAFGDPRAVTADALAWTLFYPDILVGAADPGVARAARLLATGRALEAETALDAAPASADRDALRAIIALTRRDVAAARPLVGSARSADPGSATALLAESYLRQQDLDLDAALTAADAAARAAPASGLARARLAELRLMRGETRAARAAAAEAARLGSDPLVAIVQGYTALAAYDTRTAESAFRAAIRAESQNPLALLGLGLARIRRGDLDTGRGLLEAATVHDPTSALLRSYLGRAYFEERRDDVAGLQYDIAKQLDPTDPTPWYFDAIRKQLANRPVEALRDVERSIALNEGRAGYRSGVLLDRDRAARGVRLARIYDDLGFPLLGEIEAGRALAATPLDPNAHRFVADTAVRSIDRELLRVSESFKAQLLAGPDPTPRSPRAAYANISLAPGYPLASGFGEYDAQFAGDGVRASVLGAAGSFSTYVAEGAVQGLHGPVAVGFSQLRSISDGFRRNADVENTLYDAHVSAALSADLNVHATVRHRDSDFGDIILAGDPENYDPDTRTSYNETVLVLGGSYFLSPGSAVLAAASFGEFKQTTDGFDPTFGPFKDRGTIDGGQLELEHIIDGSSIDFVYGLSHADVGTEDVSSDLEDAGDGFDDSDMVYGVATIGHGRPWSVNIGAEAIWFDRFGRDEFRLAPLLGLGVRLSDSVGLRAAFARTVKRSLVTEQTLEPSTLQGFPLLFDDFTGSVSDVIRMGVDAHIGQDLWVGASVGQRSINVPSGSNERSLNWDIREVGGYAYLLLGNRMSIFVEPSVSQFRDDDEFLSLRRLTTFAAPFGVRFLPGGPWFVRAGATALWQQQRDGEVGTDTNVSWPIDAAAGYRLPSGLGEIAISAFNLLDNDVWYRDENFRTNETRASPFAVERTLLARASLRF